MKTIPIYEVAYYLRHCAGVLLEGRFLEPIVFEVEEDYTNEFLKLEWEELYENETYTVQISFNEGDNQSAALDGSTLILTNTEGEEEELTLLREWVPDVSSKEEF